MAVRRKGVLLLLISAVWACDGADPTESVDPVVATVEVTPSTASLTVGDTTRFTARALTADREVVEGVNVQWTVDAPERVALTPQGASVKIQALRAGAARVTVSAAGRSGEALLTLANPVPALAVLVPAEAEAGSGAFQLVLQGSGFTVDSRVQWNGEDRPTTLVGSAELRAQIGADDVAEAGTVAVRVVTAGPGGGTSVALDFVVVTLPPGPVASVDLDADSVNLAEGDVVTLTATPRDAQGRVVEGLAIQWTSSGAGIAHVNAGGRVTGVRTGRTVVTARVHGQEANAVVRVKADYGFDLLFSGFDPGTTTSTPYRMDLGDGSGAARPVTFGGVAAGVLAPSPDGSRVAFVGETTLQGPGVYVVALDGSGLKRVAVHPGESCGQIDWRPDGERLAYACGFTGPDTWIVSVPTDGSTAPVVLTAVEPGREEWPSWSPLLDGGYRIAYSRRVNGEPRIFTMREDGTDHVEVTHGMDSQPAWSPDGTTIAFQRTGAAIFGDIWLVDAQGGNERGLFAYAPLAGPQWSPRWSPDGRLIAFTSRHETYGSGTGTDQVYTVWRDGTKLAKRTGDFLEKSAPAWIRR